MWVVTWILAFYNEDAMKALIVDDEPVARRVLREQLEEFEGIEIAGEAENGQVALQLIRASQPDVIFLDLQMPVLNGFETIARLEGPAVPAVVILTAYDEFAIKAFEAGAIDYLLKPVSQARLRQSVERTRRLIVESESVTESVARIQEVMRTVPSTHPKVQKIVGKQGEEFFLLSVDEVLACQADGDLTWILTSSRKYLATQNLKTLEEKLHDANFRRIHRQALINVNHIRKMTAITSQRWLMTLSNGQQFTVSKRSAKNVRDILHW